MGQIVEIKVSMMRSKIGTQSTRPKELLKVSKAIIMFPQEIHKDKHTISRETTTIKIVDIHLMIRCCII